MQLRANFAGMKMIIAAAVQSCAFVACAFCAFLTSTIFLSTATVEPGASIYQRNCAPCHGYDGTKGRWGAKNLQVSILDSQQLLTVISEGRKVMPAWKKRLDHMQMVQVRDYVLSLRTAVKKIN